MIKKYFILGGLAIVIVGTAFWFSQIKGSYPGANLPEAIVELKEEGFMPKEITVLKGQKVTFKNGRPKPFWPASDLHPTHSIYSEFDPLGPIEPGQVWTFQFKKVGEWRYHDHLFPYYRGAIKVIEGKGQSSVECVGDIREEDRFKCGEEVIIETINKKGFAAALDLLADFYKQDNFWAQNCHEYSHLIGQEAYLKFSTGDDLDVTSRSSYCGYGFYHGFMETLFAKGDSPDKARELCHYIDAQMAKQSRYAGPACFHGVGHGLVDGSDKRLWGDANKMLRPGLEICDKIAATSEENYRCYSGAFNSISIAISSGSWGLKNDPEDPLKICRQQEEKHKEACYADMMIAIDNLAEKDLVRGLKYLNSIQEDKHARTAAQFLSGTRAKERSEESDFPSIISACKGTQARMIQDCLAGFASGLIEFGQPGREYSKSLDFCKNESLTSAEKDYCFSKVVRYLSFIYAADKMNSICSTLDEKYRYLCVPPKNIR